MKNVALVVILASSTFAFGQNGTAASGSSQAAPAPALARISGGVMAGQILNKVPPTYPQEAKDQGVSGSVVLHAIISRDGTIERLEAISGPEVLKTAALEAVRQWTYKPYLLNGEPVEVDTTIVVNFNLNLSGGRLLHSVPPEVPAAARASHASGTVVSRVLVDPDGRVKTVTVVDGPEAFRDASTAAIRQWVYSPFLVNGIPKARETMVSLSFNVGQ